jgi:iron complex outermembrane receptor protein
VSNFRNPLLQAVSASALALSLVVPGVSFAQAAPAAAAPASQTADASAGAPAEAAPQDDAAPSVADIVVTGFRSSLNAALSEKRLETSAIDSIVAEDLGKFPDSNLAESMQRIPGVTLSRGDGGEGRNISVRGLGAAFTRVRINGMEGTSQTGASDIYGASNNGRSFDFNVFPTEIFTSLAVRKTPSADVEEGSLGATVDLKAAHALDQKQDFAVSASARGIYNTVSEKVDPKLSLLVSKKLADGTFGILGSFSYSDRHTREVGYSAVNILPSYVNGGFCSPVGTAPVNPALNATRGVTAANCSTNNPRTGTAEAYNYIQQHTGPSGRPGGGIFLPRAPRFFNSEQDQRRIGGSLSLQWKPTDRTEIVLDGLYSQLKVLRRDNDLAAGSFARNINDNGQPMTSVKEIAVDANGSLQNALFDGVDFRAGGQVDKYTTTFKQLTLTGSHELSDALTADVLVGYSKSVLDEPQRLGVSLDAIDQDNFSIDFRNGGTVPTLGYGFDVSNPANYFYQPRAANGDVLGVFTNFKLKNTTANKTANFNLKWEAAEGLTFKAGGQWRESNFRSTRLNIVPSQTATTALPAGTSVADIVYQIKDLDKLLGHGAPASLIAVDQDKWADAVNFANVRYCGVECAAPASQVRERITSGYLMASFDTADNFPIPIRGDAGMRYVHTQQLSVGYVPVAAPAGSIYSSVGQRAEFERSYDDWLPSVNLVADVTPDLLLRASAASVMSRAELGALAGTSTVGTVTRTATVNNPLLDPIRASTMDFSAEWYFMPGALFSVAYFHKNIKTYIQSTSTLVPFNELGLPAGLLDGSPAAPTDLFTVTRQNNTPGGALKGVEVNLQAPLRFLPGFLRNFGVLASYTHVTSKIDYILQSVNGVPTLTTTADLIGLSKNTASATLYYEDDRFSIRSTANYRGGYIRQIPSGANDSDVLGNRSTLYVDASASFNVNDHLTLILEASNLTNERNKLYIDSVRKDSLYESTIGRTITMGANVKF